MSKTWTRLGTARVNSKGNRILVLDKGIKSFTLETGEVIELDKYKTAQYFDAVDSVQRLLSSGKITEEAASQRLEYINDKRIKFEVTLPPASDDQ